MKQRIAHGATIETATPAEIAQIVAGAFTARDVREYTRQRGTIQLDANGNGSAIPLKVPSQYDWICQRVSLTGGPGALIQLFENGTQGTDLLEVIGLGSAGVYSDSFANTLYVPANSQLQIVVSGGVANGSMAFNLQIRMQKRP